jgi:hypothetical protein
MRCFLQSHCMSTEALDDLYLSLLVSIYVHAYAHAAHACLLLSLAAALRNQIDTSLNNFFLPRCQV